MFTKAYRALTVLLQRRLQLLFAVVLMLGFFIGAYISRMVPNSFLNLIYTNGDRAVSLWSLAVVLLLPLLISFVAFYFRIPILILLIGFLKAITFSFCSCGILYAYGDAGWLLRFLLLFSDSTMLFLLCWYWLRHLEGNRLRLAQDTVLCIFGAILIGIIDYMYISPFTAMLLKG